jgi:ABC-type dipeptide/oligopeptide/nickel transport system ATPase subunit
MVDARPRRTRRLTWSSIPQTGAIYILGHRGTGKSALAWYIADTYRKKSGYPKKVVAFQFPPTAAKVMPKWVKHVDSAQAVSTLTKPHIILVDESIFHLNSRRSMSQDNVDWLKLLAIVRHKGHLIIFISQSSKQVDYQMIEGCDLILIKQPSELQVRSARKELAPEVEEAAQLFYDLKGDPRKKVYMFDPHNGGSTMLTAGMPKWWTSRISKSYSEVVI